jgi:hypothetical protein
MKQTLFEYVVIWHPSKDESEKGAKSEVVVAKNSMLASNDKIVGMKAVMEIPEKFKSELEKIEIIIRPF